MSLNNLVQWALGIVLGLAAANHIDDIHTGILRAQAHLIHASRASRWGSPNFLQNTNKQSTNEVKGGSRRNQINKARAMPIKYGEQEIFDFQ